jgi:hypothetical protein
VLVLPAQNRCKTTKPRDPSVWDGDALLDQLGKRIPREDVRGRELLLDIRLRLFRYRASIERLDEASEHIDGNVDELDEMISEMADLLGVKPKPPKLRLVE